MTYDTNALPTVPGTVTTLDNLRVGEEAEIVAVLGHGECRHLRHAGLRAGMLVLRVDADPAEIDVETPGGRVVRIPRACARYIQLERGARTRSALEPARPTPTLRRRARRRAWHGTSPPPRLRRGRPSRAG